MAPYTISMVADPPSGSAVGQGQVITYTLTITNGAAADSTSGNGFIRTFDTSPLETTFQFNPSFPNGVATQPGAGSAWSCTITPNGNVTNQFTCYAGDGIGGGVDTFAANQSVVLKVDALVSPAATPGAVKNNTAFFETDLDGNGVDEVFIGSNAVSHLIAPPVDLAISKLALSTEPPLPNPENSVLAGGSSVNLTSLADLGNEGDGNLSYVLSISNLGSANATNVRIEDQIPGGPALLVNAPGAPSSVGFPVAGPVAGQPIIPGLPGVTSVYVADDSGGVPVGTASSFVIGCHDNGVGELLTCEPGDNRAIDPAFIPGVLPAGFQARLAYRLRVLASAEPGSIVGGEARIFSTGAVDLDAGNNISLTTQNLVVAKTDLGITLVTSNPTPVAGGAAFSYTLTVTNNGPSDARDIVVTDPLPPGVIFQNVAVVNNPSVPGFGLICTGAPVGTNGVVTCTGDLPGPDPITAQVSTTTITIVGQIVANVAGGVRTNTATVTSDTQETTPNVTPNSASVQQTIQVNAPLSITKSGPALLVPGQIFTYHVIVNNGGSSTAINATITDILPPETTFLNLHGTGAFDATCAHNGGVPGTITCAAVDIPTGLSTLDVTVQLSPKTIANSLANTASISTAGTGTIAVGTSTSTATIIHPDEFEANETIASATVLGSLSEITLRNLTIDPVGDQDYFQITAHDTGLLIVNAQFHDFVGNTDLEIVDALGHVLGSSLNAVAGGDEQIVIPVVSQQRYFVHVFGVANSTTYYTLEIENFAAPVPGAVDLDRNEDTGAIHLDDVTSRTSQVRYFFQADLREFAVAGISILNSAQASAANTPGAAVQVFVNGQSVGYASPVPGTQNTLFDIRLDADLANFAIGGPNAAGPLGYDGRTNFVTAAVTIFDGKRDVANAPAPAIGRTKQGERLSVIVDAVAPLAPTGLDLLASSDGGQFNNDNVTLLNSLAIQGVGEANARVVLRANGFLVGEGTVGSDATDGVLGNGLGLWQITTAPLAPAPVAYVLTATLEDLAGNIGPAGELRVLIDPEGPQVTDVYVTGYGPDDVDPYDLFGSKPGLTEPTPLVESLTIRLQDAPNRDAAFFATYLALNAGVAAAPGNFLVVGDANGAVAIQSVTITTDPVVDGQPATATIQLVFAKPLPDDRFTLTIKDSIVDPAGNPLDGESNAAEPSGSPAFPSGNGLPGGDFVARFTVDSRAELGAASAGSVYVDTNGDFRFDPTNVDFTNRDIAYVMGFTSDNTFAGNFVQAPGGTADGFDKLGVYGKVGASFRWLVDTNNDGVADLNVIQPSVAGVSTLSGMPAAGNFDGNAANGDEVVLKVGNIWLVDTNHDFKVDAKLPGTNMTGLPIVGDFDGDGKDDLGAWAEDKFTLNLSTLGAIDGTADKTFTFGFPGVRERPFAADFDGDSIDDLGLWVPDRSGVAPSESAEWYVLVSGDRSIVDRLGPSNTTSFKPYPFGNDVYAQFGDEFGLPVVGNFDPPLTSATDDGGHTNPQNALDVDNDGQISPLDALLVINLLNSTSNTQLTIPAAPQAPFVDIDRDGEVSPLDALLVINHLNEVAAAPDAPEGEGEYAADAYFNALGASDEAWATRSSSRSRSL